MSHPFINPARRAYLDRLAQNFCLLIPHVAETGMRVTDIRPGAVCVCLPPRPQWLADPERGLMNNGIVTTLVDSASGLAVFAALKAPERVATLDLRLDYLRPARGDTDLFCESECFRLGRQIAFVRSRVWQRADGPDLAVAQGAFMRTTA